MFTTTKSYSHYSTFGNIISYLLNEFVRCHRCYIVNMAHIYKIVGNTMFLSNTMKVMIGRSYRDQVILLLQI
ncbi:LytTR family transcriptional regulator DNA-binding domain-containing protein [Anaerosporobacter sp.]